MPGMLELPPLPMDAVAAREPLLRLRHSITNTNYYVEVHAQSGSSRGELRAAVPTTGGRLYWHALGKLHTLPLTGLARKILTRASLMEAPGMDTPVKSS